MGEYNFRRGAAEIEKAKERKGGGKSLGAFAPSIFWKDDKEQKYVLILNDIDNIVRIDAINFIPIPFTKKDEDGNEVEGRYFETVLARTDPALGEDALAKDPLVEKYEAKPNDQNLMVAVELEPTMEEKRGRPRPTGFVVKAVAFNRRLRDEEGNLTDEVEEVVGPVYGFIQQAANNFGAAIAGFDESEAPIHETPVKIQRIGKSTNTQYAVHGYPELAENVDLTPLVENFDGVNYLTEDERQEFWANNDGDDPFEFAYALGDALLDKRLDELADRERYDRIFDIVEEQGYSLAFNPSGKPKKVGQKAEGEEKKPRPARGTQRKAANGNGATPQEDAGQLEALERLKARAKQS